MSIKNLGKSFLFPYNHTIFIGKLKNYRTKELESSKFENLYHIEFENELQMYNNLYTLIKTEENYKYILLEISYMPEHNNNNILSFEEIKKIFESLSLQSEQKNSF